MATSVNNKERRLKIQGGSFYGAALLLVMVAALIYGGHLYRNYQKIESDLLRAEDRHSEPFRDDQTVSDIGQIVEAKRDLQLREGHLLLIWWVKTNNGKTWSCTYQGGFSQFKVGETVRVVRHVNATETDDYTAYLVGDRGGYQGAISEVWALDNDELDTLQD